MSRIPIFIEKKNRKNWNKASETCIFISCDSNTVSEIDDRDFDAELHDTSTDFNVENGNSNVRNVSLFSDEDGSTVGVNYEQDFMNDADVYQDTGTSSSISLTVVSCCKGDVNATCNCKVCETTSSENTGIAKPVVGYSKIAEDRSHNNEIAVELLHNTGTDDELLQNKEGVDNDDARDSFGKDTKMRSLIPKLSSRLKPGIVAVTPAPVRKIRTKRTKTITSKGDLESNLEEKDLTTKSVRRKEEIIQLLRTASKNRAVGETKCNERSSRSHSVFRLKITGANEITGENYAGTLNLIDLAGSERLKESGATGARLKETQNINTSLSALGNVIMALGNKIWTISAV